MSNIWLTRLLMVPINDNIAQITRPDTQIPLYHYSYAYTQFHTISHEYKHLNHETKLNKEIAVGSQNNPSVLPRAFLLNPKKFPSNRQFDLYQEVTDGDFNNLMEEMLRSNNEYDNATCESLLVEDSNAKKLLLESPDLVKRGQGGRFKRPADRGSTNLNAYYDSLFNSFLEYSKDQKPGMQNGNVEGKQMPNHSSNNVEARKELKRALYDESNPNYNSYNYNESKALNVSKGQLSKQQMIDLSCGLSMFLRSKIDSFVDGFQKDLAQKKGSMESMIRNLPSSQFSDRSMGVVRNILMSDMGSDIASINEDPRNSAKRRMAPRQEISKMVLVSPTKETTEPEGSHIRLARNKPKEPRPQKLKNLKDKSNPKKTQPISRKLPAKKKSPKASPKVKLNPGRKTEVKRRSKKMIKKMNIKDLKIIKERDSEQVKYDSEKGRNDSGRLKYDSGRNKHGLGQVKYELTRVKAKSGKGRPKPVNTAKSKKG